MRTTGNIHTCNSRVSESSGHSTVGTLVAERNAMTFVSAVAKEYEGFARRGRRPTVIPRR